MDIRDAAGHPIGDLEEPDQWERQPFESSRSFSAFCVYRDMGEDRTLRETAVQLGRSLKLMLKWSARDRWRERVAAYDQFMDGKIRRAKEKARQEMAERQAMEGVNLQTLATHGLKRFFDETGQLAGRTSSLSRPT